MDARSDTKTKQLVREAKIGLTICVLLMGVFVYGVWDRISGGESIPQHVRNAPIAQDMSEIYKAEFRDEQLAGQNRLPSENTSSLNDPPAKPIVSSTFPKSETPISFNDLRTQPAQPSKPPKANVGQQFNRVKPVGFDKDDNNSFQPFRPQIEHETQTPKTESRDLKGAAPLAPKQPQRHIFKIEEGNPSSPKLQGPAKIESVVPESKPVKSQESTQPPTSTPQKQSLEAEQEFVPLSSSFQSTFSARSTFQVQVEPADSAETATESASENTSERVATPAHVPALKLDQDDFLKAMPNSSTCLECPKEHVEDEPMLVTPTASISPTVPEIHPATTLNAPNRSPSKPDETFGLPVVDIEMVESQTVAPPIPNAKIGSGDINEPTIDESAFEKRRESARRRGAYVISENETLWSIAQAVYDDGRLFRALYDLNKNQIADPNSLEPGTEIKTPPLEELVSNWESSVPVDLRPSRVPANVYVTQKGDTVFHVARIRLGQASRFDEILELNRSRLNLDTHHLTELPPGIPLKLPEYQ